MKKPLIYGLVGLLVLVVIIIAISFDSPRNENELDQNSTSTDSGAPSETPALNPTPTSPKTTSQTPKPAPPNPSQSISITSPELDARLNIGGLNAIKWSREPGVTAGLYLVDASTNTTIGWITPTITTHQTYYTWDAKDVAVSRQSGIKKSITPGRYYIKMKFDGPISEAKSNTFYVLYPQQDTSFTHNLTIQNFKFTPNPIAVRKGEKITIQNKDSRSYTLIPKNSGESITIAPGETKTILTGALSEGSHGFYSGQHSATALSFDIYK